MFCSPMAFSIPAEVSHSRGGGLPGMGSRERPFDDETTELVEGDDVFEFNAVTESAGRGHDRVLQRDAGKAGAHVQRHRRAPRRSGGAEAAGVGVPGALEFMISSAPIFSWRARRTAVAGAPQPPYDFRGQQSGVSAVGPGP